MEERKVFKFNQVDSPSDSYRLMNLFKNILDLKKPSMSTSRPKSSVMASKYKLSKSHLNINLLQSQNHLIQKKNATLKVPPCEHTELHMGLIKKEWKNKSISIQSLQKVLSKFKIINKAVFSHNNQQLKR